VEVSSLLIRSCRVKSAFSGTGGTTEQRAIQEYCDSLNQQDPANVQTVDVNRCLGKLWHSKDESC